MKKKLIISTVCVCVILLILYVYNANKQFNQTNLSYYGINGKIFYHKVDSTGLNCKIEPNNNLKNGDVISLECNDNLTGLLHFDRDFIIKGLLSDEFDSGEFLKLISPKVLNGTAYAKSDDRGIHLIVLSDDNDNYFSILYDNLYYIDDMLYQVSDVADRATYSTSIVPSITLTNISHEYLEYYLKIYLDEGYIKIG